MKKYDDNIPLLKNRVETHAFIRNISKHRLPDGTLDVEGNLKLWNDGMQGFVKTPLWEKTPGWREDTHLQGEPYLVFVPGNPGSPTILIAHGGGFSWRTGCEGPNVAGISIKQATTLRSCLIGFSLMTVTLPWQICSAPSVYCVPEKKNLASVKKS